MPFLVTVARFISQEVLSRVGKDVLAQGQAVYDQQLAKGADQMEAARIAAKHMLTIAARQGKEQAQRAGRTAGRVASRGAAMGVRLVREKMEKK